MIGTLYLGTRGSASLIFSAPHPYSLVHLFDLSFPSASSFPSSRRLPLRLCPRSSPEEYYRLNDGNGGYSLVALPACYMTSLAAFAPGPHAPPAHHHLALHRHHVLCSVTVIHANQSNPVSLMPQYAPHPYFHWLTVGRFLRVDDHLKMLSGWPICNIIKADITSIASELDDVFVICFTEREPSCRNDPASGNSIFKLKGIRHSIR